MNLIDATLGVGLSVGLSMSVPVCYTPKLEVALAENGQIVVLRQAGDEGAHLPHNGRHPLHAPSARLVSGNTNAGSPWTVSAISDLDHVKDAVSDRVSAEVSWTGGYFTVRRVN